jgi:hypothetical protein
VLLLHLDGKLPNLALMRIAAHHRERGDDVVLRHAPTVAAVEPEIGDAFDRVYASAVFERTRPVVERLMVARPDAIVGGTGWVERRGCPSDRGRREHNRPRPSELQKMAKQRAKPRKTTR